VETARKAIALAGQQKKQRLLESISAKLPLYQAGTAYRQPPALPAPQAGRP